VSVGHRGRTSGNIHNPENRNYLRNAYRVLLTRARQGMVIVVPPGDPYDATRSPGLELTSPAVQRKLAA